MSPQPLSQVKAAMEREGALTQWTFGIYGDDLGKRQALAHYPMRVIGIWSEIDHGLILLLCRLLNAKPSLVQAMYQGGRNEGPKFETITKVAQKALADDKPAFDLFEAVIGEIRPSREARNNFAHHVWATFTALDDGLCLIDPKELVKIAIDWEDARWSLRQGKKIATSPVDLSNIPFDIVQVYRKPDLEKAVHAAGWADLLVSFLGLSLDPGLSQEKRDEARAALDVMLNG